VLASEAKSHRFESCRARQFISCLSLRDVEDLLAERGIIVSYESIRQWRGKFGPSYARAVKRRQGTLGDTWYLDKNAWEPLLYARSRVVHAAAGAGIDAVDAPISI
jgi:citrate lyase beta subunit